MTFYKAEIVKSKAQEAAARNNSTDRTPGERIAVVLMVEPGYLEYQAILLSLSLLEHCVNPFKVYTYCRSDRVHKLNDTTKQFFADVSGGITGIDPEFTTEYAHGNKIYACAQKRPEKNNLFLDSDVFMLTETDFAPVMRDNAVSVIQGTVAGWSNDAADWNHLYSLIGMDGPPFMMPMPQGIDDLAHPYFNGGFVLFTNEGLGEAWRKIALEVDVDDNVPDRRPWLDQITLPLAIAKTGALTCALPARWNGYRSYPLAIKQKCRIIHYHSIKNILEGGFEDYVSSLISQYTIYPNLQEFVQGMHAQGHEFFKTDQVTRLRTQVESMPKYLDKIFEDGRVKGATHKK